MKAPLVKIEILSIYKKNGSRFFLPERMAKCTPDTREALLSIKSELESKGGNLFLSDLFRSYDMQYQAYLDYKTGKKSAYSPPPGGSMHESGRAFDLDLGNLGISLKDFWDISSNYGCVPIIKEPNTRLSEAWHFECRGSHQLVYEYYKDGKGTNFSPSKAMAISSILALGIKVDRFDGKETPATIQSGLIRLGYDIGNIDGEIGPRTRSGLEKAGIPFTDIDDVLLAVEHYLQQKFPHEYGIAPEDIEEIPLHLAI